jgi:hypothetical protein
MQPLSSEQKIHYTLRVATAMCFIGHGAFGIITKKIWCNYFAVFGIDSATAYRLMPVLGYFDILLGVIMLVYPMRIIPLWLVIWGLVTATLRPLSGEPFAELFERAGNFGAPLAFLLLSGTGGGSRSGTGRSGIAGWFTRVNPSTQLTPQSNKKLALCLRVVVFLLLLGHGWLNILGKKGLIDQYAGLGFGDPTLTAEIVGLLEMVAACAVLIRPFRPLLLILLVWKMGSELFYPHYELFEWIERGGSYGSLLALWLVTRPTFSPYISLAT